MALDHEVGDLTSSAERIALRAFAHRVLRRLRMLLSALADFAAAGGPLS
jgi:hypothetical protein